MFLHLPPAQVEDLPWHRVQYGFNTHDFYWNGSKGGTRRCLRIVHLPQYEIGSLTTGPYNERGPLWSETFVFPKKATGGEAAAQGTGDAMTTMAPAVSTVRVVSERVHRTWDSTEWRPLCLTLNYVIRRDARIVNSAEAILDGN